MQTGGGQAVLVVVGPSQALDRLVDLWFVLVSILKGGFEVFPAA